jgi:hypothetical protein
MNVTMAAAAAMSEVLDTSIGMKIRVLMKLNRVAEVAVMLVEAIEGSVKKGVVGES